MKALTINRYGKADVTQVSDVAMPVVGAQDVLINVHAASINPLDIKIRDGAFKLILPYRLPLILGNDLAGTVVEVGSQVTQFKIGDEVYARTDTDRIGALAEYIAIKQTAVAHKPSSLSMTDAASLPLVGLTAWQALVEKSNLQAGQKILIHAGSGGVGSFAIQLAKQLGATVATTASQSNAAWVKQLGADVVIDYKTTAFEDVLQDYDVVLDTQGGAVLTKSLQVLKRGGRLISIAGAPDPDFAKEINASIIIKIATFLLSYRIRKQAKKRGVCYSFLFMQPNGTQLQQIAQLVDRGAIRPVVDRVFTFAETQAALAYVETGRAKGKVVVKM